MTDQTYTLPQVAARFGVTRHTVYEWCRSGALRAWRTTDGPSGHWRIEEEDLARFIEARRMHTKGEVK